MVVAVATATLAGQRVMGAASEVKILYTVGVSNEDRKLEVTESAKECYHETSLLLFILQNFDLLYSQKELIYNLQFVYNIGGL